MLSVPMAVWGYQQKSPRIDGLQINVYVLQHIWKKMRGVKILEAGMVETKSAGSTALIQAAAIDQAGMYIRSLVETLDLSLT